MTYSELENEIEEEARAAGFTLVSALVFGYVAAETTFDLVNHEWVEAILKRKLTEAEHNELADKEQAMREDLENIFGSIFA